MSDWRSSKVRKNYEGLSKREWRLRGAGGSGAIERGGGRSLLDVIVSDIGMAQIDGYLLMHQIRSRPLTQGGMIPAIALTAYAAEIDRQQALQAGVQRHITKPVEPEGLLKAIVTLLKPN